MLIQYCVLAQGAGSGEDDRGWGEESRSTQGGAVGRGQRREQIGRAEAGGFRGTHLEDAAEAIQCPSQNVGGPKVILWGSQEENTFPEPQAKARHPLDFRLGLLGVRLCGGREQGQEGMAAPGGGTGAGSPGRKGPRDLGDATA